MSRVLIGVLLAVLSVAAHSGNHARPAGSDSIYQDPGRTFYERFHGGVWEGAKVLPKRRLSFQKSDALYGERLGRDIHNCSDKQYRCVFGLFRIFSVPRRGLSPTETYVSAGALLRVEQCLRGDSTTCQIALISSDCQERTGPDACSPTSAGREKSREPGPMLYFIYNSDFGVTAYGSVTAPAVTKDGQLAAATQMILQGNRGLLLE